MFPSLVVGIRTAPFPRYRRGDDLSRIEGTDKGPGYVVNEPRLRFIVGSIIENVRQQLRLG